MKRKCLQRDNGGFVCVFAYPNYMSRWMQFRQKPLYIPIRGLLGLIDESGNVEAWKSFTKFPNVHEIAGLPDVNRAFRGVRKAFRKRDGTLIVVRKVRDEIFVHTKSTMTNSFSALARSLLIESIVRAIPGNFALMYEMVKWHEDVARSIRTELKRRFGVELDIDEIPASVGILSASKRKEIARRAASLAETDWERAMVVEDPYLLLGWKEGRIEFKFLGARVFDAPAVFREAISFDRLAQDEQSSLVPPDEFRYEPLALRAFPTASQVERDFELEKKLEGLSVSEMAKMKKARLPIEGWVLWIEADPVRWHEALVPIRTPLMMRRFWMVDPLLKLKSEFYVKVLQHYDLAALKSMINDIADDLPPGFLAKLRKFSELYEETKKELRRSYELFKRRRAIRQLKRAKALRAELTDLLATHGDDIDMALRELERIRREVRELSRALP